MKVGKRAKLGIGAFAFSVAASVAANLIGLIDLRGIVRAAAFAVYCAMSTMIPLWAALLAAALPLAAVSAYFALAKRAKPEDFTRAKFKGHWFEWEYADGKPVNFVKLCDKCKCEIKGDKCPACGAPRKLVGYASAKALHDDLGSFVRWHVKNGTYKSVMAESRD